MIKISIDKFVSFKKLRKIFFLLEAFLAENGKKAFAMFFLVPLLDVSPKLPAFFPVSWCKKIILCFQKGEIGKFHKLSNLFCSPDKSIMPTKDEAMVEMIFEESLQQLYSRHF